VKRDIYGRQRVRGMRESAWGEKGGESAEEEREQVFIENT
jgi:hypothetical protein